MRALAELDPNGRRLLAAKAFRSFGFGLNAVALGLYLATLGLDPVIIGLILSAALAGSMGLTLVIAIWGDRIGRRRSLVVGSALMMAAALIPFVGGNPALLIAIGLSGMIAVNNHESIGIQTIDQAVLPQTIDGRRRTAIFASYNLVASAAAAAGAIAVGPLLALGGAVGLDEATRFAPAFAAYAVCGLASATLLAGLDHRAEVGPGSRRGFALHRSRGTVAQLSALFAVDSVATGFVVHSYLAFWFTSRFEVGDATIGAMFAVGNVLAAASYPVAAWLAGRIGLIRTMVFTHIPANLFLVALAFTPALPLAVVLFFARAGLSSMDVPVRQSYTMAVVDPDERTAAAGIMNLARGGAQMIGPGIAGALLVPFGVGVPLVAGGILKTAYDLALYALFRRRTAPEERFVGREPGGRSTSAAPDA